MPRIFACLAVSNFVLLGGTALAGFLRIGGTPDRHILLAVLSLIGTCFLQVLTFTYLTVTGKMIGQMVHLGGLAPGYLASVRAHKHTVTRLLGVCMTGVVLSAATGGALWRAGSESIWHIAAGAALLIVFFFAVYREYNAVVLNARLLDEVMREYETAKSLKRNADAPGDRRAVSPA